MIYYFILNTILAIVAMWYALPLIELDTMPRKLAALTVFLIMIAAGLPFYVFYFGLKMYELRWGK